MTKRALLVLVGGRQTPNLLSAQFLRPDVVVPVASREAMRPGDAWERFKPVLETLSVRVEPPTVVDAFDPNEVRSAALQAVERHPDHAWTFNVTCATTVMSIGAYEAAKSLGVDCWYLDTGSQRVVPLVGKPPDGNPFKLSVGAYFESFGRRVRSVHPLPDAREVRCARLFARFPVETMRVRKQSAKAGVNTMRKESSRTAKLQSGSEGVWAVCYAALKAGLVRKVSGSSWPVLEIDGNSFWTFINGRWLEVHAWAAARAAWCFGDVRLGLKIQASGADNELDLAAVHAAALLIAECKTDESPFGSNYLDKLNSIAEMIGGDYVGRLFICSRVKPTDPGELRSFESFCRQARERQVVVVTGDQLVGLPGILKREAGADPNRRSTYPRK